MITAQQQPAAGTAASAPPRMLWLEITGKCQLACVHCYADSGPEGTHGAMTRGDWLAVIGEAAALGVRLVQFIGGEPTLHPDLPRLIAAAAGHGLRTEVFSNLVHVRPELWDCFREHHVAVATSYYSDSAAEHTEATGRRSHRQTRAGIARAVALGLDLRVGVIGVLDGQRTTQAHADLLALGVPAASIGYDRLRQVGRGVREPARGDTTSQLCGRCGRGHAAVSPDGNVWPCVFARWMCAGNVRETPLAEILGGPAMAALVATVPPPGLSACKPDSNGNDCRPAETPACGPKYCHP